SLAPAGNSMIRRALWPGSLRCPDAAGLRDWEVSSFPLSSFGLTAGRSSLGLTVGVTTGLSGWPSAGLRARPPPPPPPPRAPPPRRRPPPPRGGGPPAPPPAVAAVLPACVARPIAAAVAAGIAAANGTAVTVTEKPVGSAPARGQGGSQDHT